VGRTEYFKLNDQSVCHCLEQGDDKQSSRCSLLAPALPPREGKKEEKGETYKLDIKPALLILLIIREIRQNIQNQH